MSVVIGIDAAWAGGVAAGTGVYTRDLVTGVAGACRDDQLHLYFRDTCATDNPLYGRFGNPVRQSTIRGHRVPRTVFRLGAATACDELDVLLSPVCFTPLTARCPVVMTLYDLSVFSMGRRWLRRRVWRQFLAMRLFTVLSMRKAAHIITISKASRDAIVARFPAVANRCSVIYPGVDADAVRAAGNRPASVASLAPQSYFLYVGVISPTKNLERLVAAFARLPLDNDGPHLVLAGRDSGTYMRDRLRPLVARLGVKDRVHWVGFVSDAERNALYRDALAVALPSLLEGFGYPIVEAMACETPVLTSTVSSCPEVAGDAALTVDPESPDAIAEALQMLMHDASLRDRLRHAGEARARNFTVERQGEATLACLKRVVAAGRQR